MECNQNYICFLKAKYVDSAIHTKIKRLLILIFFFPIIHWNLILYYETTCWILKYEITLKIRLY